MKNLKMCKVYHHSPVSDLKILDIISFFFRKKKKCKIVEQEEKKPKVNICKRPLSFLVYNVGHSTVTGKKEYY